MPVFIMRTLLSGVGLCCLMTLAFFQPAHALEKATVQLKWLHHFQFAGYYAALEKGFYHEAGLNVTLREGGPSTEVESEVRSGRADFGVGTSALLLNRAMGDDFVVLGQIFQHSPAVFLVPRKTGIRSVAEMAGRRFMYTGQHGDMLALLKKNNITESMITKNPHNGDAHDLVNGKSDVMIAYSFNEPFIMEQSGEPYLTFSPLTYGIDFYGDNFFTLQQTVTNRPHYVKAFREATLAGWRYAMDNKEEVVDLILSKYSQGKSRDWLMFEANQIDTLIQPTLVELGYQSPLRWQHIAETFKELGMLPKEFDPTGIMYQPKSNRDYRVLIGTILFLSFVTVTLTGTVLAFRSLNRRLNKEVAERKHAAEALQQSHTLLNMLSQQVPGVLFQSCLSPDGSFRTPYASGTSQEIYELSPAEINDDATTVFKRFHPDDRERIMATIAESAEKLTPWECDYRVLLPRQGLKWLYGSATPQKLEDGSIVWYGIIMDITERIRTEAELRSSESKYRNLHESMMDGYVSTDLNGTIREYNETFRNMLGYSREEMCGLTYQNLTPEKWHGYEERIVREQVLSRGYSEVYEKEYRCSDGTLLPVELRSTLFRDETGQPTAMWAIVRDISERKHLQNESLKMQKLESLGVLAGGIAHDFNNILTGIIGNISFARILINESHKAYKILLEAEKASKRATELSHQLLTFARGSQPIKKTVPARQLIEASVALMLSGSNIRSIVTMPDDLWDLEADGGQISQAFNNLIINAAQAMPEGGILTIEATNLALGKPNALGLNPGDYVSFTFSDTGCGIPEEIQKNVFDPYFTTKTGGNGLGLASVYSIIMKHGGQIELRSTPGTGTAFEILLPASHETAAEPVPAPHPVASGQTGGSVLIMDDEEIIRDLAAELLGELGYQVCTCVNGEEAVSLYKAAWEKGKPFSATIMDLTIPGGMGGKEAAQLILELDPHACLIVSSGYSNNPVMAEHARFGFNATLQKPYTVDDMARVLNELLMPPS